MATNTQSSTSESIECPHCGATMRDLWDHDWGHREDIATECGTCDKPVLLSRRIKVTYEAKAL